MGIELFKDRIIKSFSPDERVVRQSWSGAFVGTIRYYEAPFFGVFYDDGDFEDMDLEELAACMSRQPDAIAPLLARAALEFVTGIGQKKTKSLLPIPTVGYALAPVTLTDAEVSAMLSRANHSGRSQNSLAADQLLQEGIRRKPELKEAMAYALYQGTTSLDGLCPHPVLPVQAVLGSRVDDGAL